MCWCIGVALPWLESSVLLACVRHRQLDRRAPNRVMSFSVHFLGSPNHSAPQYGLIVREKTCLLNRVSSLSCPSYPFPAKFYTSHICIRRTSSSVQYCLIFSAPSWWTSSSRCAHSTAPKVSIMAFISSSLSSRFPVRQSVK